MSCPEISWCFPANLCRWSSMPGTAPGGNSISVSYTHLDVYKRQPRIFSDYNFRLMRGMPCQHQGRRPAQLHGKLTGQFCIRNAAYAVCSKHSAQSHPSILPSSAVIQIPHYIIVKAGRHRFHLSEFSGGGKPDPSHSARAVYGKGNQAASDKAHRHLRSSPILHR